MRRQGGRLFPALKHKKRDQSTRLAPVFRPLNQPKRRGAAECGAPTRYSACMRQVCGRYAANTPPGINHLAPLFCCSRTGQPHQEKRPAARSDPRTAPRRRIDTMRSLVCLAARLTRGFSPMPTGSPLDPPLPGAAVVEWPRADPVSVERRNGPVIPGNLSRWVRSFTLYERSFVARKGRSLRTHLTPLA